MAIYDTLYDLLSTYIFGGGIATGTYADLICMLVATIGCLFVISIPFIIIWRTIRIFLG